MLSEVFENADRFDVSRLLEFFIRPHCELASAGGAAQPTDTAELLVLYGFYSDVPVVSISDAQREPLPELNWE